MGANESVRVVKSSKSKVEANNSNLTNASSNDCLEDEKVGDKASLASNSKDDDEEDSTLNLHRVNSSLLPFPGKLMSLLDGKCDTVSDAMLWFPDGDAFCLIPSVFTERVLDKHFQGAKFDSWTRKLN